MLKLKIVSPERVEFEGEVISVTVPGTLGRFEVLVNHAPIISSLEKGIVERQTPDGERTEMNISGGFIEVQKNVVSLCVEL
ncbi:MAG: ATP synthase F1 subunit epsilon [Prevotella sp.]|nr:ATP synthase F1 subunit epsilon [Prevotella sp.]